MILKGVFFDFGGTIDTFHFTIEQRTQAVPLIRECLNRAGIITQHSDAALAEMITTGAGAYLNWNQLTNIELNPAEIWAQYFLKDLQLSAETLHPVAEELAYLYETRLFVRKIRPEIPHVLSAVKAMGLKIGCISNTQSLNQVPHHLEQYSIAEYFDTVVLSSSYGRRKPDPSIFYYAARQAGLPTGSCIYVGDKLDRDILGAQRAGFMAAIQIKNGSDCDEPDIEIEPYDVIDDMKDLLPILKKIQLNGSVSGSIRYTRKIKAIFFDAGDILYFRPQKNRHFNTFLDSRDILLDPKFDLQLKQLRDMAFSGVIKRHDYYMQLLQIYGITDHQDILEGITALKADDEAAEIIDGAPETVKNLKDMGFILGIITDTALPFSLKLAWFESHGFGRLWDIVISSREIGKRKPSKEMYQMALDQAGVNPCEAVFVGHKKSELDGAKAVGMNTIAFNYDAGTSADAYIDNLPELIKLTLLDE